MSTNNTNINTITNSTSITGNTGRTTSSNIINNSFLESYMRQTPVFSRSSKEQKNNDSKPSYRTLTYSLDNTISRDLTNLYTNPICSILLKNDCMLFGDFVIEFFSNNTMNFTKTIYAYADISLKNIIERDLYGKIYSRSFQNYATYGYYQHNYKCIYENNIYDVTIYYLNYIQKLEGPVIKENALFNIDRLVVSRNAIKTISWIDEHGEKCDLDIPLPLGNLMEDIGKKQFYISTKKIRGTQLQRILKYIKQGWTNCTTSLLKEKSSQYIGKLCEICHEKVVKGERVITLKCKHFFHKDCWHETICQHINSNTGDVINCPTCRKTFYTYEVI